MNTDRDELLRKNAYHKWEAEGRPDGQHDKHWRDAEREFSTVAEEELTDKEAHRGDAPTPSTELPKVGEFSSVNK
ncbi:DUF2934 domain-containing protein [Rhizobium tumorigenes]|uniref:DUF2934 domain-containing protein n=1 Tax=Rhizobium tumorigenes TaxID=2041385 RepID=A0AAF1KSK3_9HYPH|nr:DUF2934 domain-containing protein [Rhizobium tumorigenes]WFR97643.1 DUF2934 domain-containing protein [Rhizobium tumorigenes]